jgi:diaminopropionate ammonia-lyase
VLAIAKIYGTEFGLPHPGLMPQGLGRRDSDPATVTRALLNPSPAPERVTLPGGHAVLAFHRGLRGYAPTLLRSLPQEAAALKLGRIRLKDENGRFGLPAFKITGASWALERLLAERPGLRCVWAASEGNHGRAVARAAAQRGLDARIFLPAATSDARAEAIASEGAEVVRVAGGYEDAVAAAGAAADEPGAATLADVAYDAADPVPQWVSDGYSTVFAEAREQAGKPFDVVLCQIGVGAFASAAIRFACHQTPSALVIGVEPATAACATESLAAGHPVVIDAPGTSMAGLNCATPSHTAWPVLRDGLLGCVVISDDEARVAMRDLAGLGIVAGDCGAAPLAALRAMMLDPACAGLARAAGLGPASHVLLVSTEGATDPVSYAQTLERT